MDYEPISVALKFGFLALLYLFLLFIARSALKDLRRTANPAPDSTGFHRVPAMAGPGGGDDAWLIVQGGGGLTAGERFDLFGGLSIGRSADADVQISDRYASGLHVRLYARGGRYFAEDMGSTNGTLLNGAPLNGEAELDGGDSIRIGDTEFRFEPA